MGTIADIGRGLQRYGWSIGQHSQFGGNTGGHAENSYHNYDEAIDVTDWRNDDGPEYEGGPSLNWRERTRRLVERGRQLGVFNEALGPGDKGHDTHAHLALSGKRDDWSEAQSEYLATGRWKQADGSYAFTAPGLSGATAAGGGSTPAAPATTTEQRTVVSDWKAAASAADRSTDPSSQAYWQRQDMRLWAQANPQLAKSAMARAGADPSWLESPATHTETVTVQAPPAPTTPASPTPGAQTPASPTPGAQTPAAPKPPDRGALNGTQVGGAPPRRLQPYAFEIHADRTAGSGGKTGFIGSYIDKDNPLFQSLNREYGNYGPNNSRNWRDGDLGAPRRGLSIIETATAGPGMNDPKRHREAAERLLGSFERDPDVKAGLRPIQIFAGHTDTANPAAQGAAGGDAPEKAWNTGVMGQLRQLVQQRGYRNFSFYDGIVDDTPEAPNANWSRAAKLRQQWLEQSKGGQGQ